jgi:predicted permease
MIFYTTLNQMIFLFSLIAIGYLLARLKLVPKNTEGMLSKLENYIFIPALVMGTFINNFTVEKLIGARDILLGSFIIELIVIPISMMLVRFCSKDKYTQNIYLYGLCFSNFGFMGNAVVSAIFPDIFLEYLLFTLVLWTVIYVWGVPTLLMGDISKKCSVKERLKNFINPMFIAMALGMMIGIIGISVPSFATNLVTTLGNCMSPIAMLITGMTVARSKMVEILNHKSIYVITIIRLIIYPLIFVFFVKMFNIQETLAICALCSLVMPLGLNTIVIPSAYGKDTKIASGMALVSHVLSCITIPLIFLLL